jgi:hypothetical protein
VMNDLSGVMEAIDMALMDLEAGKKTGLVY